MREALVLIACAACSHEVTVHPDAAGPARIVQAMSLGPSTGTTTTLHFAPMQAGDWLVVVAMWSGPGGLPDVTAEPVAWIWANERVLMDECQRTGVLWTSVEAVGAVEAITVKLPGPGTLETYVLEVAGLADGIAGNSAPDYASLSTPTVTAPAVDAMPGQLVVSMAATCSTLDALAPVSPFTGLATVNGQSVAFYVPDVEGQYGGEWSYGGGTWSAATVTLR